MVSKAIILARISADKDADAHGVDDQVNRCRVLAGQLGWTCGPDETHVVIENDTSAAGKGQHRRPFVEHGLQAVVLLKERGHHGALASADVDHGLDALHQASGGQLPGDWKRSRGHPSRGARLSRRMRCVVVEQRLAVYRLERRLTPTGPCAAARRTPGTSPRRS
jgi:hypothetical protein